MNNKGSAILIVLIIAVVLSMSAIYIIKLTKDIVYLEKSFLNKTEVKVNAKSALEIVKYTIAISSFNTNYVKNMYSIKFLPEKIFLDGRLIKTKLAEIKLTDTSSKINALYLQREYVRKLFLNKCIRINLADIAYDSFSDWIDEDNLKHINGAEKYYYLFEKGYKYGPRNNQALQDKEELRNIKGFEDTYEKIKNDLVFAYKGSLLNINTASENMMSILLNIPLSQAKQLIKLRKKKGSISFSDIFSITNKNANFMLDLYSVFPSKTIIIEINTEKGNAKEKLKAIIDFNPTENYPFTVIKCIE